MLIFPLLYVFFLLYARRTYDKKILLLKLLSFTFEELQKRMITPAVELIIIEGPGHDSGFHAVDWLLLLN